MLVIKRNVGESFTLRIPPNSGPQVIGVKVIEILTRFDPRLALAVDSTIRTLASYKEGSLIRIVVPDKPRVQEVRVGVVESTLCGYSARIGVAANLCVHVLRDELERENDGQ
jgi:hypothetical protein